MLQYIGFVIYGFLITALAMPFIIKFLRNRGIVGIDKNKRIKQQVPELGGLGVFLFFLINIIIVLIIQKTVFHDISSPIAIFSLFAISISALVGILDYVLKLIDLQKVFLPLFAAIPFIILQPVGTDIVFPFIGHLEFGWFIYYIILVPLAFTGATNAINMLAGLNGLEMGNSAIVIGGLSILSFMTGKADALVIGLCALGPILGFLIYNIYPARAFPGDVGTFTAGSVIACIAILGKLEFFAVIMLIPNFIEFFLKIRSNFKAENFGREMAGVLHPPSKKNYSLTHLFFSEKKFDEPTIVYKLWAFQAVFVLLSIALYTWGGF